LGLEQNIEDFRTTMEAKAVDVPVLVAASGGLIVQFRRRPFIELDARSKRAIKNPARCRAGLVLLAFGAFRKQDQ